MDMSKFKLLLAAVIIATMLSGLNACSSSGVKKTTYRDNVGTSNVAATENSNEAETYNEDEEYVYEEPEEDTYDYVAAAGMGYDRWPSSCAHLYYRPEGGGVLAHMEITPVEYNGQKYRIRLSTYFACLFYNLVDPDAISYTDHDMVIHQSSGYFQQPDLRIARDWTSVSIGSQSWTQLTSEAAYEENRAALSKNPRAAEIKAQNANEAAELNREISESNQRLRESQRNNESSQSTSSNSSCSLCNGTKVDPTPHTGDSMQKWIIYYNHEDTKCPYCGKYTAHFHNRCKRCNVPTY